MKKKKTTMIHTQTQANRPDPATNMICVHRKYCDRAGPSHCTAHSQQHRSMSLEHVHRCAPRYLLAPLAHNRAIKLPQGNERRSGLRDCNQDTGASIVAAEHGNRR